MSNYHPSRRVGIMKRMPNEPAELGDESKTEVGQTADWEHLIQQVPRAMQPLYTTSEANAPIKLYSGQLEVRSPGHTLKGEGTIRCAWTPDAKIEFEIAADAVQSIGSILRPTEAKSLVLPSGECAACLTTSVGKRVHGILNASLSIGPATSAAEMFFHLTNCSQVLGAMVSVSDRSVVNGRFLLEAEGWSVLIDPVAEIGKLRDELKERGGYAITHIGRIGRTDGTPFEISDGEDVLQALSHLLSFAHGIWIAPILIVARDEHGQKVREIWEPKIIGGNQFHMSWFSDRQHRMLPELFPMFFARWQQPLWNETFRRAIWWYIASNEKAGGLDGAVVLIQVALELLTWVVCLEDGHMLSKKGFEGLNAADKIRLLINWMKVPLTIPLELHNLVQFAGAQKEKWLYGPWAFTEVRNALVHPKNRKLLDNAGAPLYDVWRLGMWYLELAVLHACGYRGRYVNRLRVAWAGETEDVPWK
ncbi:MAG TPA: hypothetical protein VG269_23470 [Tepidisphaeraceae bacterium]|jgi:hypothetical protein|nr:hypothetical protein [Tepidisphaeraceae bacterium]